MFGDHRDLDSVEEAKREIVAQIESLEKSPDDMETPISVSLDLQMLRQSENPQQRTIGDVLTAMTELRSMVSNIDERLDKSDDMRAAYATHNPAAKSSISGLLTRYEEGLSRTAFMISELRHEVLLQSQDQIRPDILQADVLQARLKTIEKDIYDFMESQAELRGQRNMWDFFR